MIVTTTPSVDGRTVEDYLGIVTGEVIVGEGPAQHGAGRVLEEPSRNPGHQDLGPVGIK